jgi:hypothetical protein
VADKIVVMLADEDLPELEQIIVDRDAEAALEFLKRVVWEQTQRARRGRLDPRQSMGPHA